MSLNTLPPKVLERIFELIGNNWYRPCDINGRMRYLKQFALVCRKWGRIAMPIIWKEVIISGYDRESVSKTFSFYRHIINPYINCGQNIRMLELRHVTFWPVCIAKILQACPDIQDLRITAYYPKEEKVKIDLLDFIPKALPNLQRLDLSGSQRYFGEKAIQNLIDT